MIDSLDGRGTFKESLLQFVCPVSTELDRLVAELVMATGFSLSFYWGIDPSTIDDFETLLMVRRGVELSFLIQLSIAMYVFLGFVFIVGRDPRVVRPSCDIMT